METEGSLPHSQVPATCLYPEPARSNPYTTSHFLKIYLNIILPSTPGSPKRSLSLKFSHQALYTPLFSPIGATCTAHLILYYILSPLNIYINIALRHFFFSSLLHCFLRISSVGTKQVSVYI